MTRFCHPVRQLVGPGHWLPAEPFEYGWAYGVGCNNLRCEKCGEPVRSEILPAGQCQDHDRDCRRYACGCQHKQVTWVFRIEPPFWEAYPITHFPELTEWVCDGHPDLVLPVTLDGVLLDATTDWAALARAAIAHPPFEPPGVDRRVPWIIRLYRLLGAERAPLGRAVAGLLDAEDPALVRAAYDFFVNESAAAGAEHLAGSIARRRPWLSATPDPRDPSRSLLDGAAWLLYLRTLVRDDHDTPADGPALDLAKDLALAGVGPADTLPVIGDRDPEWLWTHAAALVRANVEWVDTIVYAAVRAPAARREQVLRDVTAVAPGPAAEAIADLVGEPDAVLDPAGTPGDPAPLGEYEDEDEDDRPGGDRSGGRADYGDERDG